MDRIIALMLLICLSPVILVLLLITLVNLKCNPVFVQKRTVSGKTEFDFYKIRSMHKHSPNVPTGEFAFPSVYITRWGKFLRSNSLDELLNLICIVKGDMKFIGPRPIMPCEIELIKLRSKNKINSFPGLTGLAQVNGRDVISHYRKVACERFYEIRKGSLMLRVYIVAKTIEIVIKKTGITH